MDHDHATMTGTMAMGSMSHTMSMAMPTTTSGAAHNHAGHDMGGMDMGGGGNSCKISMLFNFYTVDACFLSNQWHVTSSGMFAGSCIGVFLLAMSLEFLRRSVKEFDRFLVRQHIAKHQPGAAADHGSVSSKDAAVRNAAAGACPAVVPPFRPNVFQQAIRAFLHFLQFTVAYFLMLLAMYFNIYIIVSIILGAFFGAFIFQWETLPLIGQQTSAAQEATVCCG
ncbi:Copper Transporter integral membrane protein that functions in high affinity copper transport [Purpureocillium takamizusanense]|uniref:Copper transport protein n=1 Tax=Purpureocillium takamizusanense TaxID=2060973 RepID=A0A9Q8VFW4_9HYPO|nr:Copper Transporter integral membrane protein that functions in high affinity copper transport [Purpureocillium takamizusanense]UNI23329.1 Copper Transporter integral membrane protein that functions in high affinity copper transport [Purpureocillium takamizusanense]